MREGSLYHFQGTPIQITNRVLIFFGKETSLAALLGLRHLDRVCRFVLLLRYTVFGRLIMAIGSNETAVKLSGVNVRVYKFIVYVISGVVCALAGVISASRAAVGSPVVGEGMELDAIASVVIGGAAIKGGKGTVLNTLLGVFILGMIETS